MPKTTKHTEIGKRAPLHWCRTGIAHATLFFRDKAGDGPMDFTIGFEGRTEAIGIRVGMGGLSYLRLDELEPVLAELAPANRRLMVLLGNHETSARKVSVEFLFPPQRPQILRCTVPAGSTRAISLPVIFHNPSDWPVA